jgi:hypothetical protein
MDEKNYTRTIPPQHEGATITAESTADLPNFEAARKLFHRAKHRLLDVSNWHEVAGGLLAIFK